MTDKPKLTKKDIEAQDAMMDYMELSKILDEGMSIMAYRMRGINLLYKCLQRKKITYEINTMINKYSGFIMSLPSLTRKAFLGHAQKHRDKLNETEGK